MKLSCALLTVILCSASALGRDSGVAEGQFAQIPASQLKGFVPQYFSGCLPSFQKEDKALNSFENFHSLGKIDLPSLYHALMSVETGSGSGGGDGDKPKSSSSPFLAITTKKTPGDAAVVARPVKNRH